MFSTDRPCDQMIYSVYMTSSTATIILVPSQFTCTCNKHGKQGMRTRHHILNAGIFLLHVFRFASLIKPYCRLTTLFMFKQIFDQNLLETLAMKLSMGDSRQNAS